MYCFNSWRAWAPHGLHVVSEPYVHFDLQDFLSLTIEGFMSDFYRGGFDTLQH
jgi:hypothetical protein